jgi:hypothetical protein
MSKTVAAGTMATVVLVLTAGCFGGVLPFDGDQATPGDRTPTPDETGPCSVSGRAADLGDSLPATLPSRTGGFELTANKSSVRRAEGIGFSLTNTANEPRYTAEKHQYVVQYYSLDGWETIAFGRVLSNATLGPSHDPGEGFRWSFRASAAGFRDDRGACGPLPGGRYRFVYHNVGINSSDAISTTFNIL